MVDGYPLNKSNVIIKMCSQKHKTIVLSLTTTKKNTNNKSNKFDFINCKLENNSFFYNLLF